MINRYVVIVVIAWVVAMPSFVGAASADTERDRCLLLDSRIIGKVENAHLTVGVVHKDENNPLFKEDEPWEPRFDNPYCSVFYDEEEGIFKCWYSSRAGTKISPVKVCRLTSDPRSNGEGVTGLRCLLRDVKRRHSLGEAGAGPHRVRGEQGEQHRHRREPFRFRESQGKEDHAALRVERVKVVIIQLQIAVIPIEENWMNIRDSIKACAALGVAAALLCFEGSATTTKSDAKPNIIVVFIDDMGWADFSSFGNIDARTPNFDRMASEGIAFEQFYVNSPICSPSRIAISTGTYPQRWNITSYLARRDLNNERGMAHWLDPNAPMLARSLKNLGYATGHFGKWHMGGQRDVTEAPQISEYGFDESLTNFEGLGPKLLPLTQKPDGTISKIWTDAERLGEPVTWMQRSKITGGFIDAAIPFIEKAQQAGKPFYVNLWPDDVHSPFWPPVTKWGDGSKRQLYLGVLETMDAQFGKFFDYVKSDEQLRNNTLILICSDNGPEKGAGQAGPFKGFKTHLYEGGIRSSLIVWGPGFIQKTAQGTRNKDSVFSAIDLVPSLLRLCGGRKLPDANYDGEELLSTLLGDSDASRKQPIFFSRPPDMKNYYGFENLPDLAVRSGKWKLLCDYDGRRPELYDILADPGEKNNLADSKKKVTRKLTKHVTEWYDSIPVGKQKSL